MNALALNQPQYLFDDAWFADTRRLVRRWLPASVYPEPVLRPDRPWEGRSLTLYGSVLADPAGGYRMYYSNFVPARGHSLLMLATSPDGFTWDKPVLGLVDFDGSRENNILIPPARSPHSPGGAVRSGRRRIPVEARGVLERSAAAHVEG